jgi:threonylcarbamoyladenosine tRNA methylthiotransferase MtaB
LGCKLNQLESEALAGAFRQGGFSLRSWDETETAPDILIINTCTVTSKADQKARRIIRKALRDNPHSCVIVTGCYAQLNAGEIEALETESVPRNKAGRLLVLKGIDKSALLDMPRFISEAPKTAAGCSGVYDAAALRALVNAWDASRNIRPAPDAETRRTKAEYHAGSAAFRFAPEDFSFHTRGFLKIQDGCNSHCAYCRVRLARGPSVSLSAEQALSELRKLEVKNYAEVMLTGVNITQYQDDNLSPDQAGSLGALLEYLLNGTRRIALRLSSLEPEGISERLAPVLAHERIRPHFHLSVQSGSAATLKKMGRNYGPETVEQAAALLRSVKDDPFLAADIITGFPGETAAEFEKTRTLCQNIGFAWIHAFPYSKRPGTPAFSFTEPVSERESARRVELLFEMARHGRRDYIRRWLGRETEVLIEGGNPPWTGYCRGISANYLKLLVKYAGPHPPHPGTVLRCVLGTEIASDRKDLEGLDAEAEELA